VIVSVHFFVVQINHTPEKGAAMTLSWPEILIVLLVVGFMVAFSFRAGIMRGRRTRNPKE
jgi:Tfp pilus assembly protein PilX